MLRIESKSWSRNWQRPEGPHLPVNHFPDQKGPINLWSKALMYSQLENA